jgi:hypothetical protein
LQTLVYAGLYGQLGNQWTTQISTEGTLLSGALVAANSNDAGFYYNPASMASNNEKSFSFNTSLFRTYFLNYKKPFGEDTQLKYSYGNFDPFFLSFLLPKKNKLNVKLGASLMGKSHTTYRVADRIYHSNFSFPEAPQYVGSYEGIYNYRLNSSEYWVNFGLSKKLNDRFSIGATAIVAIRNLDYENTEEVNFASKDENNINFTSHYQNSFKSKMYNYKILFKFGVIYTLNETSRIGINFTSGSINVFGRGSNQRSLSQSNINKLINDTLDLKYEDKLISDFASGLKADFKSPLSISIGYNYEKDKTRFGITLEYFNKIESYNVIEGIDNGEMINTSSFPFKESEILSLKYEQKSIFNAAVGYETDISEAFTIAVGFRTNFNASVNRNKEAYFNYLQDIDIDYYHVTAGSTFTLLKNKFIFGLDIGFSYTANQYYIANYTTPLVLNNQNTPLIGDNLKDARVINTMVGFVLGYSFNF